MNRNKTIDYVELPAKHFPETKSFFTNVFGWTFVDYGPDYTSFSDGRLDGGFYRSDLVSSTKTGGALIVIFANDLEAILNNVRAAGGNISKEIFSFPGGRRFQFEDPNGNEFAVWTEIAND